VGEEDNGPATPRPSPKWAGCNYWVNQGSCLEEPVGTATSMHDCEGCERAPSCPLQKETPTWPHDESHDKLSVEVTSEWRRRARGSHSGG